MSKIYKMSLVILSAILLSGCELVLAPAMLLSAPAPSGAVRFKCSTTIESNDLESDLNNNKLSEHGPGFTGIYISTITGPTQALNIKGRDPAVNLVQNGKSISGTFGCGGGRIPGEGGRIWGEIEDGIIRFKYKSLDGSTGTGKWIVKPDSKEITGEWSSSGRGEGE